MDVDPRPPDPAAASGVSAPAALAAGREPPRRRARRAWLAVAALALLLGVALLAPWAMLRSTAGTAWLLARLPGVTAEGVQGALLGDRLALQRLRWQGAPGTLDAESVVLRGLRLRLLPAPGQWLALDADGLDAARLQWRSAQAAEASAPPTAPHQLSLPIALRLPVAIGAVVLDDLPPLEAVRLVVALGAEGGRAHRVEGLALRWQTLALRDGTLRIGSAAPLPLQVTVALAATEGAPMAWQATLGAGGTLEQPTLDGRLQGPEGSTARLQAALQPFARWPLQTLVLHTEALDLSALHPQAPRTRLAGRAELVSRAADAPLRVVVDLANAAPGRWDRGALPLSELALTLAGRLDVPGRVEVERLALQLADAGGRAGRVEGLGLWQDHRLALDLRLAGVAPQRLDARAGAMTLSGPLKVVLDALPSPDPAAAAAQGRPTLAIDTALDGRLDGIAQPIRLALRGRAGADEVELEALQADAGEARLRASARAQQRAGRWMLRSEGELARFDPLPWWPGAAAGPWGRGPNRLDGRWAVDASVPASALGGAPAALLAAARGSASVRLERSLLAGIPLQATIEAEPADGSVALDAALTLGGNRAALQGRLDATGDGAGDRWQAEVDAAALDVLAPLAAAWPGAATWLPRAGEVSLRTQARGRWPALATDGQARVRGLKAPRITLAEAQLDWRLDAQPDRLGAPPGTRTASVAGARRASPDPAASGILPWMLDEGAAMPWDLRLRVRDLRSTADDGRPTTLAVAEAALTGTAAAHRLQLDASAPLKPPPLLARLLDVALPEGGTQLALRLEGGWRAAVTTPDAARAGDARPASRPDGARWSGRIESLRIGGWDGRVPQPGPARAATATGGELRDVTTRAGTAAAAGRAQADPGSAGAFAPWLEARDLVAHLDLGAGGALHALHAEPGRIGLAGGIVLRWGRLAVERGDATGPMRIALEAEVEPLAVAPLLARWQPELGWEGDLQLGTRLTWHRDAAGVVEADVVVERIDGDLRVRDGAGQPLALGLTDLRLALNASDGVWLFTQALAGRTLGEAGGLLRVSGARDAALPAPGDALDGSLLARVADLGIWGAWVPPGWRLQGWVQTQGFFGGRLGAPEVQGWLEGGGLGARNLLQGVHVRDGRLRVRLEGERADVETFELFAGDGRLSLDGGATLGADPVVDLSLQADRFQLLGRIDRRLLASGGATLRLDRERLRLAGRFDVDEGLFDVSRSDAPTLSDDVTVRRPGAAPPPPAAPAAPRRATEVDLRIGLGDALRVRGHGLDTRLAGELQLTMPAGRPTLTGELRTVGGNYDAYGQKLVVERGLVRFAGAPDNPSLDVLALRPGLDVEVGVAITGSAQSPRVRLHAVPDMSESDKLTWLVLGRDPATVGRADTALLQRAALALLAGEDAGPGDALMRRLGLDDFSIRDADDESGGAVVTLGKQLSDRWYVGYERAVNATAGNWQLVYRAARRFTLRLQSGLDNAIDAIWVWRIE
ncbi:MAG: translocation/assembly module TamB domain-containing protein [Burkholderiaceae bacterium]